VCSSMLHCPTDIGSLALTALQLLTLLSGFNEAKKPTPYSKFGMGEAGLPSRYGMLILYAPALCIALHAVAMNNNSQRSFLVAALLAAHFAKRVTEVLLLHKYSGSMAPGCAFIGLVYALYTFLITYQTGKVPCELAYAPACTAAGLLLFAVGQAGNFYHHWILASMRQGSAPNRTNALSSKSEVAAAKGYSVPTRGWFAHVTMPHYFFELVAWLGIALCAQQLNAFFVFLGMASYLSGRSVATTQWYRSTFGSDWPQNRRHLVPGVW